MAVNSINANAFSPSRNVDSTNRSSLGTGSRISSGLRVSNSISNSSGFSIGQGLRANLKSVTALTQGLNNVLSTLTVATAGAKGLSNLASEIKDSLIQLSSSSTTTEQGDSLVKDLNSLLDQAQNIVANSSFNGSNLIGSGAQNLETISSVKGDTVTVSAQGSVGDAIAALKQSISRGSGNILQNEFLNLETSLDSALRSFGADQMQIKQQNIALQAISDATEEGLGSIVDANLGRESARGSAQNVRAQLANQIFNISNNTQRGLVNLFR